MKEKAATKIVPPFFFPHSPIWTFCFFVPFPPLSFWAVWASPAALRHSLPERGLERGCENRVPPKKGEKRQIRKRKKLNNVSKETGEITIKQKQKVQKAVQSKVTSGSSSVSSFLVALALCLAPCDLSSRVPCHVFPRPPALREVEGAKRQEQGQKVRARTRRHLSTQDDSFFLSGSSSTSSFGRPSPTTSRTWRPPGRRWGPATSGTWSRDCPWRRGLPLGPPLPRFSGHRDA